MLSNYRYKKIYLELNASCASNLDQLNYACMRIVCLLQPTRDTPALHSPGAPHAPCNFSSAHSLSFLSIYILWSNVVAVSVEVAALCKVRDVICIITPFDCKQ